MSKKAGAITLSYSFASSMVPPALLKRSKSSSSVSSDRKAALDRLSAGLIFASAAVMWQFRQKNADLQITGKPAVLQLAALPMLQSYWQIIVKLLFYNI